MVLLKKKNEDFVESIILVVRGFNQVENFTFYLTMINNGLLDQARLWWLWLKSTKKCLDVQ